MSATIDGGYRQQRAGRGALVLESPLLAEAGVRHGFGTRVGGVSQGSFASLNFGLKGGDDPGHVRANQHRLGATVGFDPPRLFRLRQVHGRRVVDVGEDDDPGAVLGQEADALTSAAAGTALAVVTADCVPVLLTDPARGASGAAHAGWRGIVAGVLPAVVRRLRERYGCRFETLLAAIGPCIGPCCYEVGEEVAVRFADVPGAVVPGARRPHLDLVAAARHALVDAGLPARSISSPTGLCTRCQGRLFFSFRRDGDVTGHHLSVVVVPEP